MNRRTFLNNTSLASLSVMGATGAAATLFASCSASKKNQGSLVTFDQQPLPYKYNALEPAIDAQTMEIHYTRHAAAYAKNMNDALAAENVKVQDVESLLAGISKFSEKLRNNAGGHYNHERFWKWMTPGGKPLSGSFSAIVEKSFGSISDFKNQFTNAAATRFGSGWAWLVVDKQQNLKIGSTPNQDNPLMDLSSFKGYPILGLDVWEHAYYLKYQNKRADYITAWWDLVNWEEVENNYKQATK